MEGRSHLGHRCLLGLSDATHQAGSGQDRLIYRPRGPSRSPASSQWPFHRREIDEAGRRLKAAAGCGKAATNHPDPHPAVGTRSLGVEGATPREMKRLGGGGAGSRLGSSFLSDRCGALSDKLFSTSTPPIHFLKQSDTTDRSLHRFMSTSTQQWWCCYHFPVS